MVQFTSRIQNNMWLSMTKNWMHWKVILKNFLANRHWLYMNSTMTLRGFAPALVLFRISDQELVSKPWKALLTSSMPGQYLSSWDIREVWVMGLTSKKHAIISFGLACLGILTFMIRLLPEYIGRVNKRIQYSYTTWSQKKPKMKTS